MFNTFTNIPSDNMSRTNTYSDLVKRVAGLATSSDAQNKLKAIGLNIATVAWEDTSRYNNSCWGDNISDMTLKVGDKRMPLIRSANFNDVTIDLTADKLPNLVVGNESHGSLTTISLEKYLKDFNLYCGQDDNINLYCERDNHILTSVQACVLPSDSGKVEFAVDLYNYQSDENEPAVLVIMAAAYGTSAQVVCGGNTVLYFNEKSTSRLFKAERISEYRQNRGQSISGDMTTEEKALNGIYIFQVPLKIKSRPRNAYVCQSQGSYSYESATSRCVPQSLGMERAILTLGEEKGKYKGILKGNGKPYVLTRDTGKPIRLTIQFYMCSDTDSITDDNVKEIAGQIRHIYDKGLNEGSLVVDGTTDKPGLPKVEKSKRPTATDTTNKSPKTIKQYIVDDFSIL